MNRLSSGHVMVTSPESTSVLRGRLAARLRLAADDLGNAQIRYLPAPVILALCRRAFAVAGMIGVLLDDHALPAREAIPDRRSVLRPGQVHARRRLLDVGLGPELVKRYGAGTRKADADELFRDGEAELYLSADADIEKIASTMISLAATLREVLAAIASDGSVPAELRRLAAAVHPLAGEVWAHYGGDSGSW
jgi:hypothetical protein